MTFKIGNTVTVEIARVDLEDKKLDLVLVSDAREKRKLKHKKKKTRNKNNRQSHAGT